MIWDIDTIAYVAPGSPLYPQAHVEILPGSSQNIAAGSTVYLSGLTVHPECNGPATVIHNSDGAIVLNPMPALSGEPYWNAVLETGTVRAPDKPQITLTFDLVDYSGAELGSMTQPAYVRIVLAGFGAVLPRVYGTAMIGKAVSWPGDIPFVGDGQQEVLLWGNDVITPLGTYYCISILDERKNVIQSAEYQFTGTQTVDLSMATPMAPSPGWVNVAGIITVDFQPNLILPGTGSQMSIYEITLTGDVTSNSFAALTPGIIIFEIQQDSVGGHQWLWPSIVIGGETVSPAPSSVTTQQFIYDGVAVRALGASGGSGGGGIQSINNDYTPAQRIIGTGTVGVGTANGITTINGSGLSSINSDFTTAQQIVGVGGITVSTVNGITTIAGGGGGGGGGGGPVTMSSLTFNPSTVIGGNPSTVTVTLTGTAPAGGAVVTLTNSNFDLVTGVPATVTVPAGASSTTFSVSTVTTASDQVVTITGTYGGIGAGGSITLTHAAAVPLVSITLSPTSVQGGNTSTATVTLASPAGPQGAQIALSTSDSSVAQVPTGGLIILPGQTTGTFTVTTTAITSASSATISAIYGNTVGATLSVSAGSGVTLVSLTLNPSAIVAGQTSTGTVTISGPAPAGGVVVALSTSAPNNLVTVPPTVTIPQGQTSATFTVNTSTSISSTLSAAIDATYAGKGAGFMLTIQPLSDQWIYGGYGQPGATSAVGIVGDNQVALDNGTVLNPLQNGAEQVGDWWSISVNGQAIYLLLIGGSHTFTDANTGFPFAMNPPIATNLGGRAMFLYQSTNVLYGEYKPKIMS